ncbi:MoaD/ThiS family protein [Lyngbya confervoides]|uniref:Molybdopterin synthase sulfur carrier subunit n=1 Tax=Lyngbya confervoides BDU141951 TaxID=1574623 RepID=A0ABD4T0N0_9CYAN|nr:MoaD/ThiS family protein [Lyngbya confervoides]MCM1982262.1 MoaD/ThiS family protein [Lyngbya confervoides BDU141951]
MTVKVTVKLFAAYQEAYGVPEIILEVAPGTTVQALGDRVRQPYPELRWLAPLTRYGVNYEFADPTQPLQNGDELVLIPPVSGG